MVRIHSPPPDYVPDFTVRHIFLSIHAGLRAFFRFKKGLVSHYCHPLIQPKKKQKAESDSEFSGFGFAFFRFHSIFQKKIRAGDVEFPSLYDGFPQLVPTSLFQQAQKLRTEKSQAYGGSLNPALKEIRSQICCHACGQTMHRRNLGSQDAILWQCPECRKEICCRTGNCWMA